MCRPDYQNEDAHGYQVGKGEKRTLEAMRWGLMREPTR